MAMPRAASTARCRYAPARGPHLSAPSADPPDASSIDPPTSPILTRHAVWSALHLFTAASPNPFSRSADTGRSVAPLTIARACLPANPSARNHSIPPPQHAGRPHHSNVASATNPRRRLSSPCRTGVPRVADDKARNLCSAPKNGCLLPPWLAGMVFSPLACVQHGDPSHQAGQKPAHSVPNGTLIDGPNHLLQLSRQQAGV